MAELAEIAKSAGASGEIDNSRPVDREMDADALVVRGTLPSELWGTLYRNGPNPHFALPGTHWFGGDGMLHAVSLARGRASYRNRWIRTPKWLAEARAGRPLFQAFVGKVADAPDWAGSDGGLANTNVVWHGGQLLALEEGHQPTRMDPRTLDTLGYANIATPEGPLRGPFTAHPKVDPVTGEMVFFGYNAGGPLTADISFGTLDASGALIRYQRFVAPYCSMVHDFGMTERYVLFPVLPLTGSLERAERGLPAYAWEPERGSRVGVLARSGNVRDIRWFTGEPCYVFHVMNAWEEGTRIVAEVMAFDEPPLFPRADGSPGDPARQQARRVRWIFDLAGDTDAFVSEPIDDLCGEFPRIDDRVAGRRHRHGWYAATNQAFGADGLDGIVHADNQTGGRAVYWMPAGDKVSEPVFAPRGSQEGEGWILVMAWRPAIQGSELLVFEATDVAAGPVASVVMPQRVPFGFHGNWVKGVYL